MPRSAMAHFLAKGGETKCRHLRLEWGWTESETIIEAGMLT